MRSCSRRQPQPVGLRCGFMRGVSQRFRSAIFNRRSGAKIVGSAQRRRKGAVLQHGSVLLRRSLFALELPGIAELAGVEIRPKELALASAELVSHRLCLSLQPESLSAAEQLAAAAVET